MEGRVSQDIRRKESQMIYTIGTFRVESQDHDAFVRHAEDEIWPTLESQGARALGLGCRDGWDSAHPEDGPI